MNTPRHRAGRRSAPREGGRLGVRAFTLVEMLAVLAVMGILFGAAIIGFIHFGRGQSLDTAGRLIQKHLVLARRTAMTERAVHGVEFEDRTAPQRDRLRVYYTDTKQVPAKRVTIGKWYELPPGVEFGDKSGGNMPPTDSDGIRFKRTGSTLDADTFKVHDVETEKGRTITVEAVTGRTKVD